MTLALEDRWAITELISLHGHLVDDGRLDRLEELFTADVVYDLTDFGQGRLVGVAAIREAALALGAANPVAHHVTNVVITERVAVDPGGDPGGGVTGDQEGEDRPDGAEADASRPHDGDPVSPGVVEVRSKGLGITADGLCGSVTYHDTVVRTPDGWRIARRKVLLRRVPLNGAMLE